MLRVLGQWIDSLLFTGIIITILIELSGLNMTRRRVCVFKRIPHFQTGKQRCASNASPWSGDRHGTIIFDAFNSHSSEQGIR